jgi:hypothetical protein
MKLAAEKKQRQKQRQNTYASHVSVHVLSKTELRQEWLRGQEVEFPAGHRAGRLLFAGSKMEFGGTTSKVENDSAAERG